MRELTLVSYALAFSGGTVAVLLLTPLAMRLARALGIVDRPASHKFHAQPTPYLGGLAVAGAWFVGVLAPGSIRGQTVLILSAALLMGLIGLLDDWRILTPGVRLSAQAVAGALLWTGQVRITLTGAPLLDLAVTILVVIAVTNALNLLDNMDGLLAGTAALASGSLFVVAYWNEQWLIALMAALLAGGCVGFLPYNLGGARIFLGDAGALFIGILLATIAIEIDLSNMAPLSRAAVPWLILAVPLFDMLLVVVSRRRGRRPLFRGGTDHSSHRLVALGASPRQAAMITYVVGAIAGGAALLIVQINDAAVTAVVATIAIALAVSLIALFERVELGTTGTVSDAGTEARSGST
jgi:UDP-GlcNAc:undecaprenyl-phosphate/decaprenyl-phosphate GlcNAc-1-phosphate transferase